MSCDLDTYLESELFQELLLCARYGELPELQETLALIPPERIELVLTQQDSRGNTPLHFCSANGHIDVVEHLLKVLQNRHGLDLQNEGGNTALHWACLNGHLATAKVLVAAGADVKIKNRGGRIPIDEAESQSKEAIVLWLIALDMQREKEAGMYDAENGMESANEEGDVKVRLTAGDVPIGSTAQEESELIDVLEDEESTKEVDAMDMLD